MNKNNYDELPDGYKEKYSIDAGKAKAGTLLTIGSLILTIVIFVLSVIIFGIKFSEIEEFNPIILGIFALSLIVYIVLHELTHGLFYKIFTHKKLTFGLKLTCAYCGVPDIYSKKWPMFISAIAPLVIYSIISIVGIILLPTVETKLLAILFFSIHVGGCIGDIYSCILLLKYPKDVLVQDTGAKQTFFVKEEN